MPLGLPTPEGSQYLLHIQRSVRSGPTARYSLALSFSRKRDLPPANALWPPPWARARFRDRRRARSRHWPGPSDARETRRSPRVAGPWQAPWPASPGNPAPLGGREYRWLTGSRLEDRWRGRFPASRRYSARARIQIRTHWRTAW